MINKLKRIYRFIFRNPPKFSISRKVACENHGSDYGGWTIAKNFLHSESVVYSFGIGMDISFDLSIIKKYNCKVYGFDPTPRVLDWINVQSKPDLFEFHAIGIAAQNSDIPFYVPLNPEDISHRAIDTGSNKTILVPAKQLSKIMKELGHSHIDVLKMDIEGFEYSVLPDIIESKLRPKQLLVEFHHVMDGYSNEDTEKMITALTDYNYSLFHVSDSYSEFAFIDNQ